MHNCVERLLVVSLQLLFWETNGNPSYRYNSSPSQDTRSYPYAGDPIHYQGREEPYPPPRTSHDSAYPPPQHDSQQNAGIDWNRQQKIRASGYEDERTGYRQESQEPHAAPSYMLDLYHKFQANRYSHPTANIIRSFRNVFDGVLDTVYPEDNTWRHVVVFNISSISRDEDVHLAELRLFIMVENDKRYYYGLNRRVSVYEVDVSGLSSGHAPYYVPVASNDIHEDDSRWETFTITDAVQRWVKTGVRRITLEARTEVIYRYINNHARVQVDTSREDQGPLLVVFSDDNKKRQTEQRELHELFVHTDVNADITNPALLDGEEADDDNNIYSTRRRGRRSAHVFKEEYVQAALKNMSSASVNQTGNLQVGRLSPERSRSKRRARPRDKQPCRRKPLYINFQDINWHTWIIAPKGYEAYQCSGRCNAPLSAHLTPSKHAIIQTLVHASSPKKSDTACCVPTALDPISMLYVDEEGVVTYKYKYEGMAVRECGCR